MMRYKKTLLQIILIYHRRSSQYLIEAGYRHCPDFCNDGGACKWRLCQDCSFKCGDFCLISDTNRCSLSCTPATCNANYCKQCPFCDSKTSTCDIGSFVLSTSDVFINSEDYWHQLKHSGMPYLHDGPPVFADINNDGILDYFNSMHGHKIDDNLYNRMELGESVPYLGNSWQQLPRIRSQSARIVITDDIIIGMDPHGQNLVDLDNDGILDIFVVSGGGGNKEDDDEELLETRDNFLLWGENQVDEKSGKLVTVFRGGRNAAREAGVNMRYGRGRVAVLLDVNMDGLLDIFCLQDRRKSNKLTPGILLINQGNRKWKEDYSMVEYTTTMLITDADGDGFANEILLNRGFCFPERQGPNTDPNFPNFGPYSNEVKSFCSTRPVGTSAVYKYNSTTATMTEISEKYTNISPEENKQPPCCSNGMFSGGYNCHAVSMGSADFDGDLKSDHVILYAYKIEFYFSTERVDGTLSTNIQNIGLEYTLPSQCLLAENLHIVDLNNDGIEEIIISCRNPGAFLVYTRGSSHKEWTLDNGCNGKHSLGALSDPSLSSSNKQELLNMCQQEQKALFSWNVTNDICNSLKEENKMPRVETTGFCLVDLNNDGFLDAVTTHSFGYMNFFRNIPKPDLDNQSISFKLVGDGASMNRYGIGAIVILTSVNKYGQTNQQFREISTYQHTADRFGCSDDRITFGLGKTLTPVKVQVRWPNKHIDEWTLEKWTFHKDITNNVMNLIYNHPQISYSPIPSPSPSPSIPGSMNPSQTPTLFEQNYFVTSSTADSSEASKSISLLYFHRFHCFFMASIIIAYIYV